MDRCYPIAEIAKRLQEGRLILFVGAGMSRPYLPDWPTLLKDLCKEYFKGDAAGSAEVLKLLGDKQYLAAAWAIDEQTNGEWRQFVQREFQRLPQNADERENYALVEAKYKAIQGLPFASIITTNYDSFLDHALKLSPIVHSDKEEVVELLRTKKLLKLHGDAGKKVSLILTAKDFRTMKHDCPELVHTMEAAARLYSFLFVGYSMQDEDLMGWMEHVCHRTYGKGGHHYALVNATDWGPYRRSQYAQLYDIHMVDAQPGAGGFPDLIRFFDDLRAEWRQQSTVAVIEDVRKWEEAAPWGEQESKLYVDPAVDTGPSLDAAFAKWLEDPESRALVVLGEFGTGKTWFTLKARQAVRDWGEREPRLVQLGQFKQGAGAAEIAGAFGEGFLEANAQGKLVLILDAFDEMGRKPGESLNDSFERLRELAQAGGGAKVVITCRSELFAHEIKAEWAQKLHVQFFDDTRIRKALKKRGRTDILQWTQGDEGLTDLAKRPLLLDLLLEWPPGTRPSLCKLYENAVVNVIKRGEENIDWKRLDFARTLAWRIQQTDKRTIDADTVDQLALAMVGENDPLKVLRHKTRALLVRRGSTEYEFGHLSFQEYLVAEQVREQLSAGRFVDCKLSDPIIRFIREKWKPAHETREVDGMVWIPAGPFIYGSGKEACVKNLEQGFWMDKYPVTNEDFARFLDSGVKIDKAWFEDGKKIRDPKFARHPVVKVSWAGAKAYATSQKKQLPTEEQWEKAARGVDGREYPWGDAFDGSHCNSEESGKKGTTPVDDYPSGVSPYGAREMAGNVWEWMENEHTPGEQYKSVRGGSWYNFSDVARCAVRFDYCFDPEVRSFNIGFRCSRTSP